MKSVLSIVLLFTLNSSLWAASKTRFEFEPQKISQLVETLKELNQGPFKGIYWYCSDGRVLHAKEEEKCNDSLSIQHGGLRDDLVALQKKKLFIGQILAGTKPETLLDESNHFNRIHQYFIEQWLRNTQDGWIFKKAQFYRGAIQAEDEEAWGDKIRENILNPNFIKAYPFELKFFNKYLPRPGSDQNIRDQIRWISREISDSLASFTSLRIKIHGQPGAEDLASVQEFAKKNEAKLSKGLKNKISQLEENLIKEYITNPKLKKQKLFERNTLKRLDLKNLSTFVDTSFSIPNRISAGLKLSQALDSILLIQSKSSEKKKVINTLLSIFMVEDILLEYSLEYQPKNLIDNLDFMFLQIKLLKSFGYLSEWEYEQIKTGLIQPKINVSSQQLSEYLLKARAALEWSLANLRGSANQALEVYSSFEPNAYHYIDDVVRNSPLLTLGQTIDNLSQFLQNSQKFSTDSKDLLQGARGLQLGMNQGTLRIIDDTEDPNVSPTDIVVLISPPASLKPVAGILSLSEGNPVSHVQLLARNLGIPNAVIHPNHIAKLKSLKDQKVILSVSPKGLVFIQKAEEATEVQNKILNKNKEQALSSKFTISTEKLDLKINTLPNLNTLRASHSGVICGPKAANLGELGFLFPDKVARGFVIPFAAFNNHLNQKIPGKKNITYKIQLESIFQKADSLRLAGLNSEKVDATILKDLKEFQNLIMNINFIPEFWKEVLNQYQKVFKSSPSKIGVFVRSDTNMEDLKDFTGAGLNKTVPNVVGEAKLKEAIREVWASPFSERSYLWRQKFLNNPLDIYPSVLLLESINADASGVLLTSTLGESKAEDFLLSVNLGVGGAVDGQSAESWILPPKNEKPSLRFPAREAFASRVTLKGGISKTSNSWAKPILTQENLKTFREMGEQISLKMKEAGLASPYDSELGIKNGKVVLFQVRPLVANKGGMAKQYLADLDLQFKITPLTFALDQVIIKD